MSIKLSVNEEQAKNENGQQGQEVLIEKGDQFQPKFKFDDLSKIQVWGYGVGHFFNDLCAAAFFNYLVFYYLTVLKLTSITPYAVLAGQTTDAFTTPLVGYYSDKFNTKIGKRTPWYLFGSLIMLISTPLMFTDVNFYYSDGQAPQWFKAVYYIFFTCFSNIGFASVQVSHMSLVPSLTCSRKRRDKLNSIRNTFTFLAYFVVLLAAFFLFHYMSNAVWEFQILSYIVTITGLFTSIFFLIQIKEVKLIEKCQQYTKIFINVIEQKEKDKKIKPQQNILNEQEQQSKNKALLAEKDKLKYDLTADDNDQNQSLIQVEQKENVSWKFWFKELLFYQFAFVYMGVRLYCNVFSTMINYYLCVVLKYVPNIQSLAQKTPIELALIPLALYLSSVGVSLILTWLFNTIGRKKTFSIGGVLMLMSSVLLMMLNEEWRALIYLVAFLSGAAQAICLNTSITLISEVIGIRGQDGAFVFGAYGFMDRISSGIALFILTNSPLIEESVSFIKYSIVFIPGVGCMIAWVLVLMSQIKDYGKQKQKTTSQMSVAISSRIGTMHFIKEFAN